MSLQILVTGGAGFIGSNFIRLVLNKRPEYRVTNLDKLTYSGNLNNLSDLSENPRYQFIHGSICDTDTVSRLVEAADAIVHFAAESHVDRSIDDSTPFIDTNVCGTQVLLEAVRRIGGRRFVHVSTDEVYGSLPIDRPDLLFTEESSISPNSPYAASKASSDLLVRAYYQTFGVDAVTTRCSNNYGPYQFPEKLIPNFVTRLAQGLQVPVYGDGRNVRDWIHVEDHCRAVMCVLERGISGECYNIGSDNEHSNIELTKQLIEIMGLNSSYINYVKDRLGHDHRYGICSEKIRSTLGWKPKHTDWFTALQSTVQWYLDNEFWWQSVADGSYQSAGQESGLS